MKPNASKQLRLLTLTGVLAALTTVATLLIQIPTVTKGYINLGDTVVNIAGWILGPIYGAAAAGIGSALADLIAGYTVYVPATLVIKALMAAAAFAVWQTLTKKWHSFPSRIAAAIVAELIMVIGYAVFEGFLYGSFASAIASLSGNLVQGIFGAAASVTLYELLLKRIPYLNNQN
ncbi:MAG: ECF transporter S component [Oscillospiraceae bacterium]|nr:ECF transporter S component [Oscillospiraceae bacterium]